MADIRVVYVLLHFPWLTETFVAEEIRSIQAKGVGVCIYALLPSREPPIQSVSRRLLPQVKYAPGLLSGALWSAQAYYLLKAPRQYAGLLRTVLRQPSPRLSFLFKRIAILLKGFWLARELQHESVDLIHTHFAWLSTIAGIVVSRLLGLPFTLTTHAYDIYSVKNDLLRLATGAADGIITISETNRQAILEMNPSLDSAKIRVLRCGVDLECFHPAVRPSPTKTLEITSVGRLMAKKGHEYLIRACAELKTQQVDFHCTIVGGGGLEQRLRDLVRELGLESRVDLAGPQSQEWIRDRLLRSDVFILACVTDLSGDRDGVPVSIMEAMAMGVPVISTPVSGIPELVRDGETGLLVPERDAQELAAAVVRLQKDAGMRGRVIRNGLEVISKAYDIRKNTDQLKEFFQTSIHASRQVAGSLM